VIVTFATTPSIVLIYLIARSNSPCNRACKYKSNRTTRVGFSTLPCPNQYSHMLPSGSIYAITLLGSAKAKQSDKCPLGLGRAAAVAGWSPSLMVCTTPSTMVHHQQLSGATASFHLRAAKTIFGKEGHRHGHCLGDGGAPP
jgi:hypothetical protein